MGQVLHGCATTTEAVRRAIQHSQESLRALADRYGINQKTVRKWRNRSSMTDFPTGPKKPRSTVLSVEEEAVVVAFRRHTLLSPDDCLYALQATIPHLTRSSLHRCLQRHGISRLPDVEGDKPPKKKFKAYPIGFFHIDTHHQERRELRPQTRVAGGGALARSRCSNSASNFPAPQPSPSRPAFSDWRTPTFSSRIRSSSRIDRPPACLSD
jgi:transposase-like protein